jgi:hypothetical protein
MIVHASYSDYCECLGRLKACFDSGLPDIYPIDEVVGPAREQVLVEVVLIILHKHAGAMNPLERSLVGCADV